MVSKDISTVMVQLPEPAHKSETSVEEALLKRRSVREYSDLPLQISEVSQLLWAAGGITNREEGRRTAPSAGSLYPLEIYLVSGEGNSILPGVYHYEPRNHTLELIEEGDKRRLLSASAMMQGAVRRGAVVLVIAAVFSRTTAKYMSRGRRYVYMEAGHAAQNVYLQAISLELGTAVIGAFSDSLVKRILHLHKNEEPLYLIPVGKI